LGVALFCNNNSKGCSQKKDPLLQKSQGHLHTTPIWANIEFFKTQLQKKVVLNLEKQTFNSAKFFSTCHAIENIFFLWSQIRGSVQPSITAGLLNEKLVL
jgi:hypothetical protein